VRHAKTFLGLVVVTVAIFTGLGAFDVDAVLVDPSASKTAGYFLKFTGNGAVVSDNLILPVRVRACTEVVPRTR